MITSEIRSFCVARAKPSAAISPVLGYRHVSLCLALHHPPDWIRIPESTMKCWPQSTSPIFLLMWLPLILCSVLACCHGWLNTTVMGHLALGAHSETVGRFCHCVITVRSKWTHQAGNLTTHLAVCDMCGRACCSRARDEQNATRLDRAQRGQCRNGHCKPWTDLAISHGACSAVTFLVHGIS